MLDALEPLLQRDLDILKPTDYNYTISFIGTAMVVDENTLASIESINRIGEDLGRDFEIVVSYGSVPKDQSANLRRLRTLCHNFVGLEAYFDTYGIGKKIAFEYSTGKFIVPFNAGIVYPIGYSDVLHNFLKVRLKRLFYSELSLVSRELVNDVGGWRKLSSGEDIDLFSRLSINYGVFACPTDLLDGGDKLQREVLTIRDFPADRECKLNDCYQGLRDLIISCNHSYSDVRKIAKLLKTTEGKDMSKLALLAYLGSKFSRVKPVSYSRNNYVILMESILESLILKEYLKMSEISERMSWRIDRTHIRFLSTKSKMFREMKDSTILYLKEQI